MKLFQKLLVASTTLGFLMPIAATASEAMNLEEMDSYRRSSSKAKRFDNKTFASNTGEDVLTPVGNINSLEKRQNNFEAGSFSDTTSLDGKAVMAIGGIEGNNDLNKNDKVNYSYVYQMNLNTSFTGDDNLYVRLKTAGGWKGTWDTKPGAYHIEASSWVDSLNVDKLWYTFPIGDNVTATIGPKIENYYMLAASPSVYKPGVLKAFKLGGHSSAFGASTSAGGGLAYRADNGFAASATFNSKGADDAAGLFTNEDQNKINTQVAYTADNYHLSATYSRQKGWNSWSYYATSVAVGDASDTDVNSDSIALRAWWRPQEAGTATPSISAGYDTMSFSGRTDNVTSISGYMVGLNWADIIQPDDKIGFAFGQPMKATEKSSGTLSEVDPYIWELYYSFRPNDSIEVTPAVFGGKDVLSNVDQDLFGAVVTTTFKF